MMRVFLPALTLGILLSTASFAQAKTEYVSQAGKWNLDIKESKHASGDPIAAGSIIEVTKDDGKALQFTQSLTSDKGEKLSLTFDGVYGGKQYQMHNGSTMTFKHVSATVYQDAGKRLDGASWKETCSFSADHTKLTCKGANNNKAGKAYPYTEIWNKI